MQAHQGMDTFFLERGLDFVGAKGAVGAENIAVFEAMEQFAEDGGVVGTLLAFDEVFPAAVSVVEHTHNAHDGKSAAWLLTGGLGILGLVGGGVVECKGAAVDGLDDVPLIGVFGSNTSVELGVDAGVGSGEKVHA